MPRNRSCPLGWLPLLVLALACASPLAAQLERPPIGSRTPTLILAGPSWLSAAGFIPTRLILKWRAVPNAAPEAIPLVRSCWFRRCGPNASTVAIPEGRTRRFNR